MNAKNLAFKIDSFDIALCGFMGWDDCFNFERNQFFKPDTKGKEIRRVLKNGGKFLCCSWEKQEDVSWMEEAMIRHYPAILKDRDYIEQRPIGMSYEKANGYEMILSRAGFRDIRIFEEKSAFVSTDEEEWWQQMQSLGWHPFIAKIEHSGTDQLQRLKEAVFMDLQQFKHADGIHFIKKVFFVCGIK